jgi:hypothetical protein
MAKSIMVDESADYAECFICGRNGCGDPLDWHHIFEGNGKRPLSEKYGLKVPLCHHRCHLFGENAVHVNAEVRHELERKGQERFEEENPGEDFLLVFGKNYL